MNVCFLFSIFIFSLYKMKISNQVNKILYRLQGRYGEYFLFAGQVDEKTVPSYIFGVCSPTIRWSRSPRRYPKSPSSSVPCATQLLAPTHVIIIITKYLEYPKELFFMKEIYFYIILSQNFSTCQHNRSTPINLI